MTYPGRGRALRAARGFGRAAERGPAGTDATAGVAGAFLLVDVASNVVDPFASDVDAVALYARRRNGEHINGRTRQAWALQRQDQAGRGIARMGQPDRGVTGIPEGDTVVGVSTGVAMPASLGEQLGDAVGRVLHSGCVAHLRPSPTWTSHTGEREPALLPAAEEDRAR